MTVPRGPSAALFTVAGLINATGTGFFYPFSLLFFHVVMGVDLALVGVGLTATTLAVLPLMSVVGRLIDRVGPRWVLVGACLVRAVALVGYVELRSVASFLLLSAVVAASNRAEQASTPVLATRLALPGEKGSWLALSRAVFNAGAGGGAALAGGVLVAGSGELSILALINAGSFVCAAAIYAVLVERESDDVDGHGWVSAHPWRNGLFTQLAVANGLLWVVMVAVEMGLPLYLLRYIGMPSWTVSVVFAINTGMLAILQVPVAEWLKARSPVRLGVIGSVLCGGLLGALAALGLVRGPVLGRQVVILVVGTVVYTVGELIASQAMLLLLTGTPPATERGSYMAFSQIFVGAAIAVAPGVVTVTLARWPPSVVWWGLIVVVGMAAVIVARQRVAVSVGAEGGVVVVRRTDRRRDEGPGGRRSSSS